MKQRQLAARGFLESLPAGWKVARLGSLGSFTKGRGGSKEENRDAGVPVVRYGDLYTKFDLTIDAAPAFVSEADAPHYTPLPPGSILFAASGESVDDIGKAALSLLPEPAVCGGDAIVFRPAEGVDPLYLAYALQSHPLRASKSIRSTGFTVVHITSGRLKTLLVPVPPLDQQHAVADFLIRETARIDELIAEQERLIELLHERHEASWAASFARASSLGDTIELRRLVSSITDGPFGSSLTSSHYRDFGARVIRLGNVGINEFRNDDRAFISLAYAQELSAHAAVHGDVVIAGLGDDRMPLGRAAVLPEIGPAIVKADCYRVRTNDMVQADYLAWALSAPQTRSQFMLLSRGATRSRLNTRVVQQVRIPVPTLDVQQEITADWRGGRDRLRNLEAAVQESIDTSSERRSALITAAVTGQIDIRSGT